MCLPSISYTLHRGALFKPIIEWIRLIMWSYHLALALRSRTYVRIHRAERICICIGLAGTAGGERGERVRFLSHSLVDSRELLQQSRIVRWNRKIFTIEKSLHSRGLCMSRVFVNRKFELGRALFLGEKKTYRASRALRTEGHRVLCARAHRPVGS